MTIHTYLPADFKGNVLTLKYQYLLLAIVSVTILSSLTMYLAKFHAWTITSKKEVKICWQNVWTLCPIIM